MIQVMPSRPPWILITNLYNYKVYFLITNEIWILNIWAILICLVQPQRRVKAKDTHDQTTMLCCSSCTPPKSASQCMEEILFPECCCKHERCSAAVMSNMTAGETHPAAMSVSLVWHSFELLLLEAGSASVCVSVYSSRPFIITWVVWLEDQFHPIKKALEW